MKLAFTTLALSLLAAAAGSDQAPALTSAVVSNALAQITPERIRADMGFLADDVLEGRGTGARGYQVAAKFVAAQFAGLGLTPLGSNNTFFQSVPLQRTRAVEEQCGLTISGSASTALTYGSDFVMSIDPLQPDASLSARVVFVGYGVSAPEFGYDDYGNVDVRGAIVAILSGGPAALPKDATAYYGSYAEKRQAAGRHGAAGLLIITTRGEEGGWSSAVERARDGWMEPEGGRPGKTGASSPPFVASVSPAGADALFVGASRSLEVARAGLQAGHPQGFPLANEISVRQRSERIAIESPNVVAVLRGSDPILKEEYIVYTAHLDHLGIGQAVDGDSIYNGARDNASGVAGMLAVARAFTRRPRAPRRSILFVATAAEEPGLNGAAYFVKHPPVETHRMVAGLNLDGLITYWPLRDVAGWGARRSSLGRALEQAAALLGLEATLPTDDSSTLVQAGDQVNFAQSGIPVAWIVYGHKSWNASIDAEALEQKWDRAHQPTDDMTQPFDFDSSRKLAQAAFLVGLIAANDSDRPRWKEGDFFGDRYKRR